ncbi:MAG: cyclic nucleotide-binding domain-containing protein [Magnetococcales bacterium]|nr:cyclic nucleotide-binding domain-containing protein [Magnetococcales bacterium]NGZ27490.1 cyclic nucleotide-binding domain-containing protein [Magnetococcales bacterium]
MVKISLTLDKLAKIIERNPWAKFFEWSEIETFAKFLDAFQTEKNETIFVEGEQKPFMIMLLKGSVRVFKEDSGGHMQIISVVKAGKILGEMSLVDGSPRSASAVTIEESIFLRLTNDSFQRIIDTYPRLGVKIYAEIARLLSQRLRHTSGSLVEFMQSKQGEEEDNAPMLGENTILNFGTSLSKPQPEPEARPVSPPPPPPPPPMRTSDPDDGIPKDIHVRSYILHPDKTPDPQEVVQVINLIHRRINRLDQWMRLQRAATDANKEERPQDPHQGSFLKGLFR